MTATAMTPTITSNCIGGETRGGSRRRPLRPNNEGDGNDWDGNNNNNDKGGSTDGDDDD